MTTPFSNAGPPQGTTDTFHVVRQSPSRQTPASVFLISFGGKSNEGGMFYVGRASGLDALAAFLQEVGVSSVDIDSALEAGPHHQIANVGLTRDFLSRLGL
jgi:hypothetical protein